MLRGRRAFKYLSFLIGASFLVTIIIALQKIGHDLPSFIAFPPTHVKRILVKSILVWSKNPKHFSLYMRKKAFKNCPVKNCEFWDRHGEDELLPEMAYDALLFLGYITEYNQPWDIPKSRGANQRYIFFMRESPGIFPLIHNLENFFNWTATYRQDSDIYMPYFKLQDSSSHKSVYKTPWQQPTYNHISEFADIVANKTKLVAWFVTANITHSKRDIYVRELTKYIPVDIYGPEGQYKCPHLSIKCDLVLDSTYKFYLSFENSLCKGYVTEKLKRALEHDVIPVVYGGANYSIFAPPMSYINVKDFDSPKHLAEYLHYLDRNPQEYLKYFWWKKFYEVVEHEWLCELCEKLNDPSIPTKIYPSMDAWWNYPGVCPSPNEVLQWYNFSSLNVS